MPVVKCGLDRGLSSESCFVGCGMWKPYSEVKGRRGRNEAQAFTQHKSSSRSSGFGQSRLGKRDLTW